MKLTSAGRDRDALAAEIERAREDREFTSRMRALLERNKEILDRLAE